jgi:hypothetical protein
MNEFPPTAGVLQRPSGAIPAAFATLDFDSG